MPRIPSTARPRACCRSPTAQLYRGEFKLVDNTVRVPFGDIAAIENAFRSDPAIGVIVLETVQGGGGIVQAPAEYWQKLRKLCDQYGVIWVADEVQCGYGRTGRFYAFEHYGVVPDVTALAKSLGGGKAAVGAMIASRERLHEGLWHAEDGDDPCAGDVRRHRRGLRHGDRRRSTSSMTRA